MAQNGKAEYWEERYTSDSEPFDWYQRWSELKDILAQYVFPTHQILHLGCGNSRLSEEMYDEGFINSINIDISQVVIKALQFKYLNCFFKKNIKIVNIIKAMQEKYRDKQTMRFLHVFCKIRQLLVFAFPKELACTTIFEAPYWRHL